MPYELISLIFFILRAVNFLIIIRVFLSWFVRDPHNPIMKILTNITDPILKPIQRVVPSMGGFDLSPLIAIFLLNALGRLILQF